MSSGLSLPPMSTIGKQSSAIVIQHRNLALQAACNLIDVDGEVDKDKYIAMFDDVGPIVKVSRLSGSSLLLRKMHKNVISKIFQNPEGLILDEGISKSPFTRRALLVFSI